MEFLDFFVVRLVKATVLRCFIGHFNSHNAIAPCTFDQFHPSFDSTPLILYLMVPFDLILGRSHFGSAHGWKDQGLPAGGHFLGGEFQMKRVNKGLLLLCNLLQGIVLIGKFVMFRISIGCPQDKLRAPRLS